MIAWLKRCIGMCPWCGESLHPGRKCHNDDVSHDIHGLPNKEKS